jgi:hypothetical protein
MAIYDLRCAQGHVTEVIQSYDAPLPPCRVCGAATGKLPSRVSLGGQGRAPASQEAMPQTWRGTYGGDPEYLTGLRRQADSLRSFQDTHPEEAGDRRPILAHEGPYEGRPLRQGDPVKSGDQAGHGHSHAHPHSHGPTG